jgi:hypothetical protein
MARIAPVDGTIATTAPGRLPRASAAAYWTRASTVNVTVSARLWGLNKLPMLLTLMGTDRPLSWPSYSRSTPSLP